MLSQLLEDKKKKPKAKTTPKKSTGKRKEGRAHLLHILKINSIPTLSHPSLHLMRRLIHRMGVLILKG